MNHAHWSGHLLREREHQGAYGGVGAIRLGRHGPFQIADINDRDLGEPLAALAPGSAR